MKRILAAGLCLLLLAPAVAAADGFTEPGPPGDSLGEKASPAHPASSMQERGGPLATAPAPRAPTTMPWWPSYTEEKADAYKITCAVLLILLLSAGLVLEERKQAARYLRSRKLAAALLGIAGVAGWFNYGKFHYGTFVHVWEHYHYYVGSKYFPELRYSRLYQCSAIAESELGRRDQVAKRQMRDIAETNIIGSTADILAHPERCKDHFTPERWADFKKDVAFFMGRMGNDQWERSQKDHGFNGTPWWAALATPLANRVGPASNASMNTLALIDPTFIILMFLCIWWAFGVEIFAVAATFMAVNHPSRYYWNGGAYLRYDYLASAVIGVCLLKKKVPVVAGALLAWSASLRIFPMFFSVGPLLQAGTRWFKEKVFDREHKQIVVGAVVAVAILVPAAFWVGKGGPEIVAEFAHNTLKHEQTPLTNHMGLRTVLSFRPWDRAQFLKDDRMEDPFQTWKEQRLANFHQLQWLYWLLNLLFLYWIARATKNSPAWMAAALSGIVLSQTAAELTNYYYAFLIPGAFLMEKRKEYGLWLVLLAICTQAISRIPMWEDDRGELMSVASLAFGLGVLYDMVPASERIPAFLRRWLKMAPVKAAEPPASLDDARKAVTAEKRKQRKGA